jgi:hypothetical protein
MMSSKEIAILIDAFACPTCKAELNKSCMRLSDAMPTYPHVARWRLGVRGEIWKDLHAMLRPFQRAGRPE